MGRKKTVISTPVKVTEQKKTISKLLEDKMDKIMEMMTGFNECLQKQEEKSMLPVPSARSLVVGKDENVSLLSRIER